MSMSQLGIGPQNGDQLLIYKTPPLSDDLFSGNVVESNWMEIQMGTGPHDAADFDAGQIVDVLNANVGYPGHDLVT